MKLIGTTSRSISRQKWAKNELGKKGQTNTSFNHFMINNYHYGRLENFQTIGYNI
mgnify:CR=1 FL=1